MGTDSTAGKSSKRRAVEKNYHFSYELIHRNSEMGAGRANHFASPYLQFLFTQKESIKKIYLKNILRTFDFIGMAW